MDRREWVDRLFRAHAGELFRYLRTFRLSEEETYDLVQDAFVRLLRADPSRIRQPKVWLFTVARNQALNTRKRARRQVDLPDLEELSDASPGPLADLLEVEEHTMLWRAFQRLPAAQRELMGLYLDHEFSYRQIAKVLGKSEISIRVAMHRSRNQIRQLLGSGNGRDSSAQEKEKRNESNKRH